MAAVFGFWTTSRCCSKLTNEILDTDAHLFKNRPMTIWDDATRGGVRGHMFFAGENPPYIPKRENIVRAKLISGGLINYYLKSKLKKQVIIEIADISGKFRRSLSASNEPGINRALWDFRSMQHRAEKKIHRQHEGCFQNAFAHPQSCQRSEGLD